MNTDLPQELEIDAYILHQNVRKGMHESSKNKRTARCNGCFWGLDLKIHGEHRNRLGVLGVQPPKRGG